MLFFAGLQVRIQFPALGPGPGSVPGHGPYRLLLFVGLVSMLLIDYYFSGRVLRLGPGPAPRIVKLRAPLGVGKKKGAHGFPKTFKNH